MSKFLAPQAYLPHETPLLLLDEVCSVDTDSVHCVAIVDTEHSLGAFVQPDGLPSFFGMELMAQCVGVWAGYRQLQRTGQKLDFGMLLGARGLQFTRARFEYGARLDIKATLLLEDGRVGSFDCRIEQDGELLSQGRINTLQADLTQAVQLLQERA